MSRTKPPWNEWDGDKSIQMPSGYQDIYHIPPSYLWPSWALIHMASVQMEPIGTLIDETGTLLSEQSGLVLRRDLGGRWKLDLHRVSMDHIGTRARITGVVVGKGLVDVDGIEPAD
ncbi:DUF5818 domain-containing protein [Aquisediminimonas profunda]|uniref:DUF5818 domain-containing protein n=1 Tax=Aquisediminimonas profunda TaxID=1550733 RepID=UPI001FEB4B1C|nr:DUF5818 domain-containing protein [Aquisediminimonas profunda]